ncbi:MAG: aconitate hydratase AcnA [Kiritimatiellae bacterium]|nr:aconitate hydratase AcnA [Kiritimatiellia bacterium]
MSAGISWRTLTSDHEGPVVCVDLVAFERFTGVPLARLPRCVRPLIEAVLRRWDEVERAPDVLRALAGVAAPGSDIEVPFWPTRVLLQDFTGVPCVADLAALRSEIARRGGQARRVEPLIPVDLVIDHSVQIDVAGSPQALAENARLEFERNRERYEFLRWGQAVFGRLRVFPPGLGICHQVNMEHLAEVIRIETLADGRRAWVPDTVVGTDSHTTMINSLGVLGWGVGGIEAEAAMLGQPIPLAPPRVVGVRLTGRLPSGATATDAALMLTQRLRAHGVVDRMVEFFGPGLAGLSVEDRAPLANMAPEYGATTGWFPVDASTLVYLRRTGRPASLVARVEQGARALGLWWDPSTDEGLDYESVVEFDLGSVEPTLAGPRRPHERLTLSEVGRSFEQLCAAGAAPVPAVREGRGSLDHGAVVVAAITSCTNTSNPSLLIAAGLVARRAVERGLRVPWWVKTSFAPGSLAAAAFLRRAGLLEHLEALGFHIAAYGCATCIGNSGPLRPEVEEEIRRRQLVVAAVLSGNRNFEGRVHPLTRANYLASPPMVVIAALRGTVRGDWRREPVGVDAAGRPVGWEELWPSAAEVAELVERCVQPEDFVAAYADPAARVPAWAAISGAGGEVFAWRPDSTYLREPPFVRGVPDEPAPLADIERAAVLVVLGDFVTTDHISPAGNIPVDSPAGRYLQERGVRPAEFNSYGARRGNHEVMIRGTFANVRLRNRMVEREGGWTLHVPSGEVVTVFEAAERYRAAGVPLVVIAGRMYGAGSSRDWAAKGPALLGVRAVIAESFERIHRSNLVEMGVLPLQFSEGHTAAAHGLTGHERVTIRGLADLCPGATVQVIAERPDGSRLVFEAIARLSSRAEIEYLRHGGILPYVLRTRLLRDAAC